MLLWLASAHAEPLLVPTRYSLADAVAAYGPGDEIVVDGVGGPIDAHVLVDKRIVVRGARGAVLRSTDAAGGVFDVNAPGATVVLQDLTVEGDAGARALRVRGGTLRLVDVVVREGDFAGAGGAIRVEASADALVVVGGEIRGSVATGNGGCVATFGGRLDVAGTSFVACAAGGRGGAIAAEDTVVSVRAARFTGSSADRGGAVWADAASTVTIASAWFERNEATTGDGGAVTTEGPGAAVSVTDSTFRDNDAADDGGALFLVDGGTVIRSVFCENTAVDGAAVAVTGGTAELRASVFLENRASAAGALWASAPTEVNHAAFWANRGGDLGHAVVSRGTDVTVYDSVLFGHGSGRVAFHANTSPGDVARWDAWFDNTGGDASRDVRVRDAVTADPLLAPTAGLCDPGELRPRLGSPLLGAGQGGADLGPFGGGASFDRADRDGDGDPATTDCDDLDPARYTGNAELANDNVDGDCDGNESCFLADGDADGLADGPPQPTYAPTCPYAADPCPGDVDNVDTDEDGRCDLVDLCVDDPADTCAPGGSGTSVVDSGGSGARGHTAAPHTGETGAVGPAHTGLGPDTGGATGGTGGGSGSVVPLLPVDPGCGCGAGPRPRAPALFLAAALAVRGRRRRAG
jgi:hypothetical protein